MEALSYDNFKVLREKGHLVIDTRPQEQIIEGFIPGSLSVPFEGNEKEILGRFVEKDRAILLVGESGDGEKKAGVMKGYGYSNIAGWLEEGITTDVEDRDFVISISGEEVTLDAKHDKNLVLFDLRDKESFEELHIENSANKSPEEVIALLPDLKNAITYYIMCENGDLSMALVTFLKMNGIHALYHVGGGFSAIKDYPGLPLVHKKKK